MSVRLSSSLSLLAASALGIVACSGGHVPSEGDDGVGGNVSGVGGDVSGGATGSGGAFGVGGVASGGASDGVGGGMDPSPAGGAPWEAMAAVALAGAAAEQNRGLVVERRPQGAPGTM